ncbi:hypothetical protein [Actinoplanes sp. HUAS TT8]|uniref:hypothetical protein n=1 Tax=Actinoplanes sp. HUAS TT8 TaxID=3447453 RepID=UPI003F52044F
MRNKVMAPIAGLMLSMVPAMPAQANPGDGLRPAPFDYSGVSSVPCVSNQRSTNFGAKVNLYITNDSSRDITVYYYGTRGTRSLSSLGTVDSGTSERVTAHIGVVYEIKYGSTCLGSFVVETSSDHATITYS